MNIVEIFKNAGADVTVQELSDAFLSCKVGRDGKAKLTFETTPEACNSTAKEAFGLNGAYRGVVVWIPTGPLADGKPAP